jgi:short-subunit dehydrogenase
MGKTVLITGASSGIGLALALEYQRQGCTVIATSRNTETLISYVNEQFHIFTMDVTEQLSIDTLLQILKKENLFPDIIINNAGYGLMGPAAELPDAEIKEQFETNFFSLLRMIRTFTPWMCENGKGMFINMGSISGIAAIPFSGIYSSSKAAVHAVSDSLRMELAPFNIHVMLVQPGGIVSNFGNVANIKTEQILSENSKYLKIEDKLRERGTISQVGATPAEIFAKKVVKKSLRKNPPSLIRTGHRSFTLPFMKRWLPIWWFDAIMKKHFGLKNLTKK